MPKKATISGFKKTMIPRSVMTRAPTRKAPKNYRAGVAGWVLM